MQQAMLISRNVALVEAAMADEMFALDVDNGQCFSFNATANSIWQLLERPTTLAGLCDALTAAYDIDRATCEAEVAEVIAELERQRLVTLTPP